MKFKLPYLSHKKFLLFFFGFFLLRFALTAFSRATLMPDVSMLDDFLVYEAARNISAGRWLGAYGFMTIGKHMLFSVWLALLNFLNISFLHAGQALYLSACSVLVFAFNPVIKNRFVRLLFFTVIAFNPASFADFTLRVYRDNISVSVFLLVFASLIGFALRSNYANEKALWGYGILGGLSLGASFLLREDGVWLLPFAAAASLIIVLNILKHKKNRFRRVLALSLIGAAAVLSVGIYSFMNYLYYGRFIISDMTSSEFSAVCGALTRVTVSADEYNPIAPLPYSSRLKLYENCPSFKKLEPYLESEYFHRMRKDVGGGVSDFSGGGYYWAVRNAASLAGCYSDAETAKAFFKQLADEINAVCDSGKIAAAGKRSGINAPITVGRIAPTFAEAAREFVSVMFYGDVGCSPEPSIGSGTAIAEMEKYLSTKAFALKREYNGNFLVILTAYSAKGPVSAQFVNSNGSAISQSARSAAGGDIYVKRMLAGGGDTLYTDSLRSYITAYEEPAGVSLSVLPDGGEILVPVTVTGSEMIEANGILYGVEYAGSDYTEISDADYGFFEIWSYRAMRVLTALYGVLMPLLFALGTAGFVYGLISAIKKRADKPRNTLSSLTLWISAGLLLSGVLRLFMVAFVEVSAFGIGTYPMYFAVVYPLFIAFAFSGFILFFRARNSGFSERHTAM